MCRTFATVVALLCVAFPDPAAAQSYIMAALGVDVVRVTGEQDVVSSIPAGDGEALSGALRVGTSLGAAWGVELEVARGAAVEQERRFTPDVRILAVDLPSSLIFPPITIDYRLRQHHLTLTPAVWVRQYAGARVDLAYLGGIAFTRTSSDLEVELTQLPPIAGLLVPVFDSSRRVQYGVGPMAGFEARIALTDRARLTTGIRMQTVGGENDGWLVRAAAGLGWVF